MGENFNKQEGPFNSQLSQADLTKEAAGAWTSKSALDAMPRKVNRQWQDNSQQYLDAMPVKRDHVPQLNTNNPNIRGTYDGLLYNHINRTADTPDPRTHNYTRRPIEGQQRRVRAQAAPPEQSPIVSGPVVAPETETPPKQTLEQLAGKKLELPTSAQSGSGQVVQTKVHAEVMPAKKKLNF